MNFFKSIVILTLCALCSCTQISLWCDTLCGEKPPAEGVGIYIPNLPSERTVYSYNGAFNKMITAFTTDYAVPNGVPKLNIHGSTEIDLPFARALQREHIAEFGSHISHCNTLIHSLQYLPDSKLQIWQMRVVKDTSLIWESPALLFRKEMP